MGGWKGSRGIKGEGGWKKELREEEKGGSRYMWLPLVVH